MYNELEGLTHMLAYDSVPVNRQIIRPNVCLLKVRMFAC